MLGALYAAFRTQRTRIWDSGGQHNLEDGTTALGCSKVGIFRMQLHAGHVVITGASGVEGTDKAFVALANGFSPNEASCDASDQDLRPLARAIDLELENC